MAVSRKDALKRLRGLAARVDEHLQALAMEPNSRAVGHWTSEIHNWLNQMEVMVSHVGKKTGAEWQARIEAWRQELA
jgi:hypothetical protein